MGQAITCGKGGRTAPSRPGRSVRRPECAPAGAAGSGRQRPALLAARADLRRQPFRAADHQVDGARIEAPALQLGGQLLGAPGASLDLQVTMRSPGCTLASMASPSWRIRRATSAFLPRVSAESRPAPAAASAGSAGIFLPAVLDPARHLGADGDQPDLHLGPYSAACWARLCSAPCQRRSRS
jgi:hypothetical protein